MKILLRSTAFFVAFSLFLFFSIRPLLISSCDRLYIYTDKTSFNNTVSLNCLHSDHINKKGWIFFQGPSHISPKPIANLSNESIITIDTTHFPVGDYQAQYMAMSGQKPLFSNWHPFTIVSDTPTIAIPELLNQGLITTTPHISFNCTSNQPLTGVLMVICPYKVERVLYKSLAKTITMFWGTVLLKSSTTNLHLQIAFLCWGITISEKTVKHGKFLQKHSRNIYNTYGKMIIISVPPWNFFGSNAKNALFQKKLF
jgi:hypothetical protein